MTKAIRIENADTSPYKVVVEVWDKGRDGAPDTIHHQTQLIFPTALAIEYITDSRYLVVKELTP